jgi:hypothetical protein
MKEEKLYDEGNDEVALKVMADTDGLVIEAQGENASVSEKFSINWAELIESMIRVAGKLG